MRRNLGPSIEDARYWFDQYLQAAGWEARLIDDIENLRRQRQASLAASRANEGERLSD